MPPLQRLNSAHPTTATFHIRLVQRHEVSALALIGVSSFIDDPLDAYLYPDRRDNPREYALVYQRAIEKAMRDGLSWVIVAETPGRVLVGYAIWTRESENASKAVSSLHIAGLKTHNDSMSLPLRFAQRLRPTDIVKPLTSRMSCADAVQCIDVRTANIPRNYWRLYEVAVVPTYRFQGVGRQLLGWGHYWATVERLPMMLETSRSQRITKDQAQLVDPSSRNWKLRDDASTHDSE